MDAGSRVDDQKVVPAFEVFELREDIAEGRRRTVGGIEQAARPGDDMDPARSFEHDFAGVSEADRIKMTCTNAAELYGFQVGEQQARAA